MGYIDDVFGPDGYLSQNLEGYEERPGQIKMAKAVDEALAYKHHLMVEAPTGTGKSLAYGAAAAYYSRQRKFLEVEHRVIISTANIALQEQLIDKDFPFLAKVWPWGKFSYVLAKGRRNYLCRRLYDKAVKLNLRNLDVDLNDKEREMALEVLKWGGRTGVGDISELSFDMPPNVRRVFTCTSEDCLKEACFHCAHCFCTKAKERIQEADIIVCNYHLLFAHLKVREEVGKDLVLPSVAAVILDEAHETARVARNFFGDKLSYGAFEWATRLLKKDYFKVRLDVLDKARIFFERLKYYRASSDYEHRLKIKDAVEWVSLYEELDDAVEAYEQLIKKSRTTEDTAELTVAARRCLSLKSKLEDFMGLKDANSAYSIEDTKETKKYFPNLEREPIYVNGRLKKSLFGEFDSVILTSATLATTGGSFNYIARETGVPDPRVLVVETPFNFEKQAITVCGTSAFEYDENYLSMPWDVNNKKRDNAYNLKAVENFKKIIQMTDGRVLGLFTSHKSLKFVGDCLCKDKDLKKWNILMQREGGKPRMKLLAEFKEDVSSVLLGTASFWSGVDVPGEALSCVVIDKIPFPNPSSPIHDALRDLEPHDYFRDHSLPHAIIMFKQGFGRLIRTAKDRGVVVLLDPRLSNFEAYPKSYRYDFFNSLPRMYTSHYIKDIGDFFGNSK